MPYPWRAGMLVTAERLNAATPLFVFKGSSEDRTGTTTPAPDTDLTLTLGEGIWDVEAFLDYSGTTGSGGIQVAWSTTMTTVSIRRSLGPHGSSTNRLQTPMRSAVHGMGTAASYGGTQDTGLRAQAQEAMVLEGPGDLTLMWAQISSSSEVTRLAAGSYLRAERVG